MENQKLSLTYKCFNKLGIINDSHKYGSISLWGIVAHTVFVIKTAVYFKVAYKPGIFETKLGRGFRILHFGNIVINPATVIGDNFNIAQGCLIGDSWIQNRHGSPIIGNNVCMFANSIIVGGVNISDNVIIAPGAFVNFDVPRNLIVIGNPGKIIHRDSSPTKKYIVYPISSINQ